MRFKIQPIPKAKHQKLANTRSILTRNRKRAMYEIESMDDDDPIDIEAHIASEHYFTAADGVYGASIAAITDKIGVLHDAPVPAALRKFTFCVLVLKNGLTITGESAPDPATPFDGMAVRIAAWKDAMWKVGLLTRYRQRIHAAGLAGRPPDRAASQPDALGMAAPFHHLERIRSRQQASAHPIKTWRKFRGLTQHALAAKAGISKPYLSQLETGKRTGSLSVIRALAAALDTPVGTLETE